MAIWGWIFALVAFGMALTDWWAVFVDEKTRRFVAKPGALAALTLLAITASPASNAIRAWMVLGLLCSLAGDVFLLLPARWFIAGLGAFLCGHIFYVNGLLLAWESWLSALAGLALVAVGGATIGRVIVGDVSLYHSRLTKAVMVYLLVISAMVVAAFGTGRPTAIFGALLFYASDAILAWNRFVNPLNNGNLAVMVTYHLGQAGLVWWAIAG